MALSSRVRCMSLVVLVSLQLCSAVDVRPRKPQRAAFVETGMTEERAVLETNSGGKATDDAVHTSLAQTTKADHEGHKRAGLKPRHSVRSRKSSKHAGREAALAKKHASEVAGRRHRQKYAALQAKRSDAEEADESHASEEAAEGNKADKTKKAEEADTTGYEEERRHRRHHHRHHHHHKHHHTHDVRERMADEESQAEEDNVSSTAHRSHALAAGKADDAKDGKDDADDGEGDDAKVEETPHKQKTSSSANSRSATPAMAVQASGVHGTAVGHKAATKVANKGKDEDDVEDDVEEDDEGSNQDDDDEGQKVHSANSRHHLPDDDDPKDGKAAAHTTKKRGKLLATHVTVKAGDSDAANDANAVAAGKAKGAVVKASRDARGTKRIGHASKARKSRKSKHSRSRKTKKTKKSTHGRSRSHATSAGHRTLADVAKKHLRAAKGEVHADASRMKAKVFFPPPSSNVSLSSRTANTTSKTAETQHREAEGHSAMSNAVHPQNATTGRDSRPSHKADLEHAREDASNNSVEDKQDFLTTVHSSVDQMVQVEDGEAKDYSNEPSKANESSKSSQEQEMDPAAKVVESAVEKLAAQSNATQAEIATKPNASTALLAGHAEIKSSEDSTRVAEARLVAAELEQVVGRTSTNTWAEHQVERRGLRRGRHGLRARRHHMRRGRRGLQTRRHFAEERTQGLAELMSMSKDEQSQDADDNSEVADFDPIPEDSGAEEDEHSSDDEFESEVEADTNVDDAI